METIKLYQQDVYLKQCNSEIIDLSVVDDITDKSNHTLEVVLNQTIFFPEGGGQPCDFGYINEFTVFAVNERDGLVYHTVDETAAKSLHVGDTVNCCIDWDRRFDNMQRHCGEHILSGMFFREYGGVNRGFHMGDEYMTIDINLEEDSEFTELTWDMAMHVERCANEAIWAGVPVITRYFNTKEETEQLPLRKKLTVDEDIIIVCVGDINNASDCVACCGTHPSTAGQVGLIKILKLENYKGMTRIYCEAGKRAFLLFENYHEVLTKLNNKYSSSTNNLFEKIAIQDEKTKASKNELFVLKQSVTKERVDALEQELLLIGNEILTVEYADMKVDDLLNIGRPLIDKIKKLLLIVSPHDNTLLLFSNGKSVNCGKLVKENASIYNGKGGGNQESARALFPNREYLDTFIDLLDKHLR